MTEFLGVQKMIEAGWHHAAFCPAHWQRLTDEIEQRGLPIATDAADLQARFNAGDPEGDALLGAFMDVMSHYIEKVGPNAAAANRGCVICHLNLLHRQHHLAHPDDPKVQACDRPLENGYDDWLVLAADAEAEFRTGQKQGVIQ